MNSASKQRKVLPIILLVLSLCLAVGVVTLFRPCAPKEDGTWMHCHDASLWVMGLALATAAAAVLRLVLKKGGRLLDALIIALAAFAGIIPGRIISLCMMGDMRCNLIMKPAVTVFAVLLVLCGAVDLLWHRT